MDNGRTTGPGDLNGGILRSAQDDRKKAQDDRFFLYKVSHPEYGAVEVQAPDLLHAVVEAAHAWGVVKWSDVARDCEALRLGPVPATSQEGKKGRKRT